MNEEQVKYLISQKELGWFDLGVVRIVRPTGRFIESTEMTNPDYYESRYRWQIEVKTDLFSRAWISSTNLKTIKKAI